MIRNLKKIRKRNTFIHVIDNAVKKDVYDILNDFTEDKYGLNTDKYGSSTYGKEKGHFD